MFYLAIDSLNNVAWQCTEKNISLTDTEDNFAWQDTEEARKGFDRPLHVIEVNQVADQRSI